MNPKPPICKHCRSWEISSETDRYCGWCGALLVGLEVRCLPPGVFAGTEVPVDLAIRNSHDVPTTVQSVQMEAAVDGVEVQCAIPPAGLTIPAQKEVRIPIDVSALEAPADLVHVVVLEVRAGTARYPVRIEVRPRPEIEFDVGEFEVSLDGKGFEEHLACLRISRGAARVESIRPRVDWITRIEPATPLPMTLDAVHSPDLELRVHLDENWMAAQGGILPRSFDGEIEVQFERGVSPMVCGFRATCYKPPHLTFWEDVEGSAWRVPIGGRGRVTLRLQNVAPDVEGEKGLATLELRRIQVVDETGRKPPWLGEFANVEWPIRLASGERRVLTLDVAAGAEADGTGRGDVVGLGEHDLQVHIWSNAFDQLHGQDHHVFYRPLEVHTLPDLDGFLVLDFGTSNTCCAVTRSGRFDLIPVDEVFEVGRALTEEERKAAPSAILYLKFDEPGGWRYNIGTRAAAVAHTFRRQAFTEVKRSLGNPRTFRIDLKDGAGPRPRKPWEIASDYLARIRTTAEEMLGARARRVMIAHPVRCSWSMIQHLESAVRAAFGADVLIEKIPEPMAAALYYVVRDESVKRPEYRLLVYDYGGGTTDITLLQVRNVPRSGGFDVHLDLMGSGGVERLGGSDATHLLMEMAVENALAALGSSGIGGVMPRIPLNYEEEKERAHHMALDNFGELKDWAEKTKIGFSMLGDAYEGTEGATLRILAGSEERSRVFMFSELAPTCTQYFSRVRDQLESGMESMREVVARRALSHPDVVLLTGRASQLPPVAARVREVFPPSDVELCPDPKECVVQGGCILELYREASAMHRIVLPPAGTLATTMCPIGYRVPVETKPKFREIWPPGTPIPEGGLVAELAELSAFSRETIVTIFENRGVGDDMDRRPEQFVQMTQFRLASILPSDVADGDLAGARARLKLSRLYHLSLVVRMTDGREFSQTQDRTD